MAYLLKNARLVDPQVVLDKVADVLVEGDRIAEVGESLTAPEAQALDLAGKVLVPGLVDVHVHFRDPGFEQKEDIASGSRAAVHGGFTDVCTMPNTKPETDNADVVDYILQKAAKVNLCHIRPSAACTKGRKGEQLTEMGELVAHGALAFTDDGRGVQDAGVMRRVMDYGKMFGKVVMSHCQDEGLVGSGQVNEGVVSSRLGLEGWPAAGEEIQIERDISLSQVTGCPIHIQHITSARGLEIVKAGKERGVQVTCEVTPNHLFLTEDSITEGYETQFKINPPLRTEEDRKALVQGIIDGTIDCIVTDHAPHTRAEKAREFELAPFGMTGLETSLASVLTHLVRPGLMGYDRLVEVMAVNPRKLLGLEPVKLEAGSPADLTVMDPELAWTVTEESFCSKANNSGFLGHDLVGKATEVLVSGRLVLKGGEVIE